MGLDLLASVRAESDRFADVLRAVDPAARVPSCPDWTAADLLWHLAEVHYFWAAIVRDRIVDEADVEARVEGAVPDRPEGYGDLLDLYRRTTDDLVTALVDADDADVVWTWAADQSVGFVRRFQAHEATVHRLDAELTAGLDPTPIPVDLATDGVDVVLRLQKTWRPGWADWRPTEAIGRVSTTDTGAEWGVRLGTWSGHSPDSGKTYDGEWALEIVDVPADPAFTVSAPAVDLDAFAWHRPGFADVLTTGDAERFVALIRGGVQ